MRQQLDQRVRLGHGVGEDWHARVPERDGPARHFLDARASASCINRLAWHLPRDAHQICHLGAAGHDQLPALFGQGLRNPIHIGRKGPKFRVQLRIIVEAASDPPDEPLPGQSAERHVDRGARAKVEKVLGRERPAAPLSTHTSDNSVSDGCHVDFLC